MTCNSFLIYILAGYNYYGNERIYSGVNGKELEVDIFIGIVYYQRLRHMVADKYQVRGSRAKFLVFDCYLARIT